jgi:E3 ubiquitin-protein ligase HERC3
VVALADEKISSVQCGASHSLALTDRGLIYCWGKNSQGQCGLGHVEDVLKPSLNAALQPHFIVQVAAGWEHSVALTALGEQK